MPRANTKVFPTAPQKWQKYVFAYTWEYVFLLYHHIPLVVLFSFFFNFVALISPEADHVMGHSEKLAAKTTKRRGVEHLTTGC